MGTEGLDRISEYLREAVNRPYCIKCCLARVDPPARVCGHCSEKATKKKAKFAAFMAKHKQKQKEQDHGVDTNQQEDY